MNGMKTILLAVLVAAGGVALPPAAARAAPGPATIGFEAGLPLVAGFEASYRVRPAWRLGLQFGRVSGLTALGAEARWLMGGESHGFAPSLVAGAEQYFLEDGGQNATPVGVHLALGIDYFLYRAPVSLGAELGVMSTFGSTGDEHVKVFSIRNNVTKPMFNVAARYHF